MSEVIESLLKNPQLLSALADKVYERLKDEIVIKHLDENSQVIRQLMEEIRSLQQAVKEHSEAIKSLQRTTIALVREQRKLSIAIGSFTGRAGRGLERAMLNLYKKALVLHGADPKKVVHGRVVDTLGVVEKNRIFEVDFYETNDQVYLFEVKNYADEAVIDQVLNRWKVFSSLYTKPVKIFVVANYVEREVKEELEKEGVEVIASQVVD